MTKKFTVILSEDELIACWAYLGEKILNTLNNSKEKDITLKDAFKAWKKLDKEAMKI